MTVYQSQSYRVRQLFSTLAAATASNPVLLEGEKWNEKDATTGRATGRTKTGDGVVSADKTTITGTAFNDLPFDPGNNGGAALSDAIPQALGTASAGTASTASRSDHRHAMPTAAQVGADATGTAAAAVAAHAAAADPHPAYTTAQEAAAAAPVQSVAGRTGAVVIAAADVAGLGTAATTDATAYATAAQGAKADSAVQPAGLASYVQASDSRLSDAREWSAATATQAEAEAGSSTTRLAFTPLRVFQAIAAWWAGSAAKTKLDGIAAGATANATDAQLRDRSTHTGSQAASTITGLAAVATSGDYADLSGKPTLGTAAPLDVAATGDASATQVVKGNDSRLSNARTPTAHTQAASTITGLATVATSGSYSDLTGKPSASYASGNWFTPIVGTAGSGGANSANTISLMPFTVGRSIRVNELGARITVALASSSFQLAIYGSSSGLPSGTPLATTASMSGGTAATLSSSVTAFDLTAGELYWAAVNVNSGTTLAFAALAASSTHSLNVLGSPESNLTNLYGSSIGAMFNRSVSQTFATWPDLTGVTTTLQANTARVPIVFLKISALL